MNEQEFTGKAKAIAPQIARAVVVKEDGLYTAYAISWNGDYIKETSDMREAAQSAVLGRLQGEQP